MGRGERNTKGRGRQKKMTGTGQIELVRHITRRERKGLQKEEGKGKGGDEI